MSEGEAKEVTRDELEALMFQKIQKSTLDAPAWADVARLLLESIKEREKAAAKKRPRGIGAPVEVPRQ